MRATQFIGLNAAGKAFVADLEPVPTDACTYGMFDEPIALRAWRDDNGIVREIVQISPWSSGPVILTCLEYDDGSGRFAEWKEDSRFGCALDVEAGIYYI
jgi:hypothetical protein